MSYRRRSTADVPSAREIGARDSACHTRTARAGRLNSGSLSRSELTVVLWLGTGCSDAVAQSSGLAPVVSFIKPKTPLRLHNLIPTHTTPEEGGCKQAALAYFVMDVTLPLPIRGGMVH